MAAPDLRYRRQPLMRDRIDVDAPLVGARLYKGARPVVLARLERTRAGEPQRTVPVTLNDLRHQVDIERGGWDDRRDIPSVTGPNPGPPEFVPSLGDARRVPDQTPQAIEPFQHRMSSRLAVSPETSPMQIGPDAYPTSTEDQYAVQRRLSGLGAAFIEQPVYRPRKMVTPSLLAPITMLRGLGVTAIEQPVYRPRKMVTPSLLAPITVLRGLGVADEFKTNPYAVGATGAVILGLVVVGGYFAGAAMAPAGKDKALYGVIGSVAGLFTGPIGLGALGLLALSGK